MACPLCEPSQQDVVLLQTPNVRVICDIAPITLGHVLIAPIAHAASVADLDRATTEELRLVQREVGRRLLVTFGEVGHYEHGRSVLCRFHVGDPRHVHAHIHSVPIAFDLIAACGAADRLTEISSDLALGNRRYLYQDIGDASGEWATQNLPETRHFVRVYMQQALAARGVPPIPVDAAAEHDLAIDETRDAFRAAGTKSPQSVGIFGSNEFVTSIAAYISGKQKRRDVAIRMLGSAGDVAIPPDAARQARLAVRDDVESCDLNIAIGDAAPPPWRIRPDVIWLNRNGLSSREVERLVGVALELPAM